MKKQPQDYKNIYPDFSYKNLTRNLRKQFQKIDSNGYWAFLGGAGNSTSFYLVNSSKPSALKTTLFHNRNATYLATLPVYVQYKLQFHIALSEEKNNLHAYEARGQAWDIIKDILINHEVRDFKIIRSTEAMSDSEDGHQTGKDVTDDAYIEPQRSLAEWNTILNEIHAKLLEYNVPLPSKGAKSSSQRGKEYPILGTPIITYRYDIPLPTASRDFVAEFIRISPYSEIKTVDFTSTSQTQTSTDTGSTSPISSTHLMGITQKKSSDHSSSS